MRKREGKRGVKEREEKNKGENGKLNVKSSVKQKGQEMKHV